MLSMVGSERLELFRRYDGMHATPQPTFRHRSKEERLTSLLPSPSHSGPLSAFATFLPVLSHSFPCILSHLLLFWPFFPALVGGVAISKLGVD